jgi:hypothetical protein
MEDFQSLMKKKLREIISNFASLDEAVDAIFANGN